MRYGDWLSDLWLRFLLVLGQGNKLYKKRPDATRYALLERGLAIVILYRYGKTEQPLPEITSKAIFFKDNLIDKRAEEA